MKKLLKCIMLIDDNPLDNYIHERQIKRSNAAIVVISKTSGLEALKYLKLKKDITDNQPDLIFLDINMPGMNGWEFLQEYCGLDKESQSKYVIIMLTTSDNPDDMEKARSWGCISDYITKPLTKEIVEDISVRYFC